MSKAVRKLNVWRLVTVSYLLMYRHLRGFLVVGWLPIAVLYGVGSLFDNSLVLHVLVVVWFLVRWYRLVLLDHRVDGFQEFSALRYLRFAGYYLLLEAAPSILARLTASVDSINWIWFHYPYELATLRFILILPSVALDAPLVLFFLWAAMSAIAVSRIYRGLIDDGHLAPASVRDSV